MPFPHSNKQFCSSSCVPYSSAQLWQHLFGDGIRFHRLRAECQQALPVPFQTPITSPGYHLCYWLTGYKPGLPMTPSLGLINLLEWLTELRETSTHIVSCCQGYKGAVRRFVGCRGPWSTPALWSITVLSVPPAHPPGCSPKPKAQPFGFLWRLRSVNH